RLHALAPAARQVPQTRPGNRGLGVALVGHQAAAAHQSDLGAGEGFAVHGASLPEPAAGVHGRGPWRAAGKCSSLGRTMTELRIETPKAAPPEPFTDPHAAVDRLQALYAEATGFLCAGFEALIAGKARPRRLRAFYPQVAITTTSFAHIDSRLSFGHVPMPGHYAATITRPDLFRDYLIQQLGLLTRNHKVPL